MRIDRIEPRDWSASSTLRTIDPESEEGRKIIAELGEQGETMKSEDQELAIMAILADGETHSSADLAASIGVSPAQLRTALGRLRKRDQIVAIPQIGTSSYLWSLASAQADAQPAPSPSRPRLLPRGRVIRQWIGETDLVVSWERDSIQVEGAITSNAALLGVLAIFREAGAEAFAEVGDDE